MKAILVLIATVVVLCAVTTEAVRYDFISLARSASQLYSLFFRLWPHSPAKSVKPVKPTVPTPKPRSNPNQPCVVAGGQKGFCWLPTT